jgi:hypothetical protein
MYGYSKEQSARRPYKRAWYALMYTRTKDQPLTGRWGELIMAYYDQASRVIRNLPLPSQFNTRLYGLHGTDLC